MGKDKRRQVRYENMKIAQRFKDAEPKPLTAEAIRNIMATLDG